MRALSAVVIAAALLGSDAQAKTVTTLERRLTPAQSETVTQAVAAVAKEIVAAARRAGPSCETSPVRAVDAAVATASGLAPIVPSVHLRCGDGGPTIDFGIGVDPNNRKNLEPPANAPVPKGLTIRLPKDARREAGRSSTFVQSDTALLRIDVRDEARPGAIAAQLDAKALLALTRAFAPLPHPARAVHAPLATGAEAEQAIVSFLIQAGARGKNVQVARDVLEPLSFDVEALTAAAPDVDPQLFVPPASTRLPALPPLTRTLPKGAPPDRGAGRLSLSPIAFSADGRQAAIATSWFFGPLDGIWRFTILQRGDDGSWSVAYDCVLGMS